MDWEVVISRPALRDLAEIHDFIATRNPHAAAKVGADLISRAESLAVTPYWGMSVSGVPNTRKLVHAPYYTIFYRTHEQNKLLEVIRVWDGRRDPSRLELPKPESVHSSSEGPV